MLENDVLERTEHSEAAEEAGLRYVNDTIRGIQRQRNGDGFVYIGANGHRISNERKLNRIRSLVIPPGWTDVWICPYSNGHLQVTARDARGRKQYRYHPKYRAVRDETKFDRMLAFSKVLPAIREQVEADFQLRGLPRRKILAVVVWLLEKTLIRVGNAEYAKENETFGLTTLLDRHVAVNGATVEFAFRGKSGKEHSVSITDRRLARIIQRCQTLPGEELFQYVDEDGKLQRVDSGDINDYLRDIGGEDVTAKDFRTWAGTMLAGVALREIGTARPVKIKKSNIVRAIDQVAEHLGNTRTVCRKYYIHPVILKAYMRGKVIPATEPWKEQRGKSTRRLRRNETAVLQFIEENQR